ncbi:alpha/beta fold hydrolase [Candidatus Parcubacteria bacterium]|nr:alpha/beta fold hydrolase [Candidatus Parcubacteria bacterium]
MQWGFETFRTRFARDIVAQCRPAERETNKVAIVLPGCPGYPLGKRDLVTFLGRKGFFTIIPSYRGTWESDGVFLEHPPSEDVELIIDELPKGFMDLWSEGAYRIAEPEVYLIGASFGGAAAILASKHPRVKKAVSVSGVVDWREQQHTVEPIEFMSEYMPKAYGQGYRPGNDLAPRLSAGDFYNPVKEKDILDGTKLLLIHAKGDRVVHAAPAQQFAKGVGARYVELAGDEHMGVSMVPEPRIWKHIEKFFRTT